MIEKTPRKDIQKRILNSTLLGWGVGMVVGIFCWQFFDNTSYFSICAGIGLLTGWFTAWIKTRSKKDTFKENKGEME